MLHFGRDPDPRIRTTDIQIRILSFSSVTFTIPTKNIFSQFFCFLVFEGKFASFFKDRLNLIGLDLKSFLPKFKHSPALPNNFLIGYRAQRVVLKQSDCVNKLVIE